MSSHPRERESWVGKERILMESTYAVLDPCSPASNTDYRRMPKRVEGLVKSG